MSVAFQIPAGPMNLATLFPDIDFEKISEYYIELKDQDDDSVILTTPSYRRGCCCDDDTVRIFFVNYLGGIDAVNFKIIREELDTSSSRWKKPLQTPHAKWDGGAQRFNITSNESVILENSCFKEADQAWLKELVETPNAWIQWTGTQGQDDDYIPIVIRDGKFITRKESERYSYVLQLTFDYANENQTLRN